MKIFGLVGEKLSHSMSPEIHNEIFKLLNENAVYNLFEVDEDNVSEVGDALRVLNIKGINVTIPYKEELINSVDELSQEAEKIGAINTILNKDGVLKGYNTDYYGFGRMLKNFNVNLKNKVVEHLKEIGYEVEDVGTYTSDSVDYPIYAKKVAHAVADGKYEKGIIICGTGIGVSIVANKVKGIRASLCGDTFSAKATRQHNNSNILCMGERVIGAGLALDIVDIWLTTEYEGGRHQRRIDMMED